METVLYKLESFEGPLDLLLHLISKNKIDICDIPIAEITEQYLEAIAGIEDSRLENASEFMVMAAQLLYIKSKMLLPKPEEDDEEDPREDLAARLLEYKKYKEASRELRKKEFWSRYMFFKEPEKISFPLPEYNRHHEISELTDAFAAILERRKRREKPTKKAFMGIVGREKVSVEDMVEKVCKILDKSKRVRFQSIFKKNDSKPEMIATFLAILEMIKLNKITADYDAEKKDFIIAAAKGSDRDIGKTG